MPIVTSQGHLRVAGDGMQVLGGGGGASGRDYQIPSRDGGMGLGAPHPGQ